MKKLILFVCITISNFSCSFDQKTRQLCKQLTKSLQIWMKELENRVLEDKIYATYPIYKSFSNIESNIVKVNSDTYLLESINTDKDYLRLFPIEVQEKIATIAKGNEYIEIKKCIEKNKAYFEADYYNNKEIHYPSFKSFMSSKKNIREVKANYFEVVETPPIATIFPENQEEEGARDYFIFFRNTGKI